MAHLGRTLCGNRTGTLHQHVAVACLLTCGAFCSVSAHDLWFETLGTTAHVSQEVHFNLVFGHLDEQKILKPDLQTVSVKVIAPDGTATSLQGGLEDVGYVVGRFRVTAPGVYTLLGVQDKVVTYEPARSIRCAKTFVTAGAKQSRHETGYGRKWDQPLEILAEADPGAMRVGARLPVRVLYDGKPLPGAQVEIIPRGRAPKTTTQTDAEGKATLVFDKSGWFLVVADHKDPTKRGEKYEFTKLSATLAVVAHP